MDTVILIALNVLPIAVILALWPWFKRRHAKGQHFSNVTTVTVMAASALICEGLSHFPMYIKIGTALLVAVMWFLAYRFRGQEPVATMALLGLGALLILASAA